MQPRSGGWRRGSYDRLATLLSVICTMLEQGLHEPTGVDDRAVVRVDASSTKTSLRSARRRQQPTGRRRESVAAQLSRPMLTSGGGATQVQALQEGLLRLFEMGMNDQLLWAAELKMLIATKVGISLHCCTRTVNRALGKLAAHTPLIAPVGRKWQLRFGSLRDAEAPMPDL